ncbi:MAG: hypothetical protein FWD41_00160 [Actinomycetia bacterium]|nr:hypothetical protein [Actinomycetes bacterium]
MSPTTDTVSVRFPFATRQRQVTIALGCIFIGILIALALLWLLVYQSVIASTEGPNEVGPYSTQLEMTWYGAAGELLRQPSGIAFDEVRKQIFITDSSRAMVYILNMDLERIGAFNGGTEDEFRLELPTSIAVASTGQVYVVDAALQKIVIFDDLNRPVRAISFTEEPPKAVTVIKDPDGVEHLWVLSYSGVSRGSLDGDMDWGYFARGDQAGQFNNPSDLAGLSHEESTTIFISDTFNYRVQAFDVTETGLELLWIYGDLDEESAQTMQALPVEDATDADATDDTEALDVEEQLLQEAQEDAQADEQSTTGTRGADRLMDLPVGVTTNGEQQVFVLDGMGATVLTLDRDTGDLITAYGAVGTQEGQMLYPSAIAYGNEQIWIVDQGNGRLSVYSQQEKPAPPQLIRDHFPLELLWLVIGLLMLIELGCLLWLATMWSTKLVFALDALERIDAREKGSAMVDVVETIYVAPGNEAYALQVCSGARIATATPKKRIISQLEPLREKLSAYEFDTLAAAGSLKRAVLVTDSNSDLFVAALQSGIPVIDVTELIQYADTVIEEEFEPIPGVELTSAAEE